MSSVNSKQESIAETVLEVLKKFPNQEDRQAFADCFVALSFGPKTSRVARCNNSHSSKTGNSGASRSEVRPPKARKGQRQGQGSNSPPGDGRRSAKSRKGPGGSEEKKSSTKPGSQPDPGLIAVVNMSGDTSRHCNLLRAVLSDCSKARRQTGANPPRMDHVSIRKRVGACRKRARRALKQLRTTNRSEGEALALGRDLVNSIKSFRLVFEDAFNAKVPHVNIGADLESNFIGIEGYNEICERLDESGLEENPMTLFWEDPKGILPSSLSEGIASTLPNPFDS
jgi:hypothetical protein